MGLLVRLCWRWVVGKWLCAWVRILFLSLIAVSVVNLVTISTTNFTLFIMIRSSILEGSGSYSVVMLAILVVVARLLMPVVVGCRIRRCLIVARLMKPLAWKSGWARRVENLITLLFLLGKLIICIRSLGFKSCTRVLFVVWRGLLVGRGICLDDYCRIKQNLALRCLHLRQG